jgi:hypothetical protein
MGYDMTMVQRDESLDAELAAATAAFDAAVREREGFERGTPERDTAQAAVSTAFAAREKADLNYFRLNIWDMGHARDDMDALGMLATEYSQPPWPLPAEFGITQDEWWNYDHDLPTTDERLLKMQAAVDAMLSWSPPDEPGIPMHKLGSNDGWVVTALDLTGALALYDRAPIHERERVRDSWVGDDGGCYWDEWIAFLRRAEALAGFRVY